MIGSLRRGRLRIPHVMPAPALILSWILVLGLALAGCEYPGVPNPQAAAAAPSSPSVATAAATSAGTPAAPVPPPATPEQSAVAGTVEMALKDFELVPRELTVKAGQVKFVLTNEGRYTHDFRLQGEGLDENAGKLGARRSGEWEMVLKPGTYRMSCRISNHDQRGMVGTLTVVE